MRATQTRKGLTDCVLVKERERSIRFNRELGGERQLQVLSRSSMMGVGKVPTGNFDFQTSVNVEISTPTLTHPSSRDT